MCGTIDEIWPLLLNTTTQTRYTIVRPWIWYQIPCRELWLYAIIAPTCTTWMASLSAPSHHCVAPCGSLLEKLLLILYWNPVQILNLLQHINSLDTCAKWYSQILGKFNVNSSQCDYHILIWCSHMNSLYTSCSM